MVDSVHGRHCACGTSEPTKPIQVTFLTHNVGLLDLLRSASRFPMVKDLYLVRQYTEYYSEKESQPSSLNTFQLRALSIFFVYFVDDHQILVTSAQP
jgi:hypothetical protein